MQIEDFSLGQCIGKGAFGEVYLTTRIGYNKLYATKKIPKKLVETPSIKKHLVDELEILKTLDHKNIIKLETIKQSENNYYIITDYYNGGGLYDILKKYKMIYGRPFPENVVQHLMRQIIDAVVYLHQRKIIHRDLKLENLLINFESEEDKNNLNLLRAEVKIIDFGFATRLNGSNLRYSILGSPINMDPILLTKLNNKNISYLIGYDEKADIWSLGTVCYEMATGEMVFKVQDINQLLQRVEIGIYHIPTNLSQELVSFLEGMLQYLGKDRLSAIELSSHPFLTKDVSEFTKIDITNPNNTIDGFGLVVNIKKGNPTGFNAYDIMQRLNINPYSQQTYNNQNYQQGYNYFGNPGPKYYSANVNGRNYGYQYIQRQKIYQNLYNYKYNSNTYQPQNYKYQDVPKINIQTNPNYTSQRLLNNHNKNNYMNKNNTNNIINQKRLDNNNMEQKMPEYNNNDLSITNLNNNNINKNKQNDFVRSKTNIPLPDRMNSNSTSIPYSKQFSFNKQMPNSSFLQTDHNNFYSEFIPKSKMNNSFIINKNPSFNKKFFTQNDYKKEISSEALDNLFDFNIGKELEPEPDINIDIEQ